MARALQGLLGALGAAAIGICLAIELAGAEATGGFFEHWFLVLITSATGPQGEHWSPSMDSELRFYAPLFGAYGLMLLATARNLTARAQHIPWLMLVFFVGGLGRLLSWLQLGAPQPVFAALTAIELLYPIPVLLLWLACRRTLQPVQLTPSR